MVQGFFRLAGRGDQCRRWWSGTALVVAPAMVLAGAPAVTATEEPPAVEAGQEQQAGPREGVEPPVTEPVEPREARDRSVQTPRSAMGAAAANESLLGVLGYYTLNTTQLTDRERVHVNPANGNLVVEAADLSLPGVAGTGLSVSRYYNSRQDPGEQGAPGAQWSLSVGQDVRLITQEGGPATLVGPSGYELEFPSAGEDTWDQPSGLNATLEQNGTGQDYFVQFHDTGLRYRFLGGQALTAIWDQHDNKIQFDYDSSGRLVSINDTKGDVTTVDYHEGDDGGGGGSPHPCEPTAPGEPGRPCEPPIEMGVGTASVADRVVEITDPDGRTITYGYDGADLTRVTDQDGQSTEYAYDGEHNLTQITDPEGNTTQIAYDGADRVVSITWADSTAGEPAVTEYDYTYQPTVGVIDQRGHETTYVFDQAGRVETVYTPRSGVGEEYAYDVNSNVTSYTTNSGGIGTLTYDGYNVQTVARDNGATSTFEYQDPDNDDRPSKFTDARGVTLTYDWDDKNQLQSVTDGANSESTMDYQDQGDPCPGVLESSADGRGHTTTYHYDSRCRQTTIDRPTPAGDSTLTYDRFDRVATVTDGNGHTQHLSYDPLDRVTEVEYVDNGTAAGSVSYAYDGNGNRTARVDTHDGNTTTSTWTLDARNRVVAEDLANVTNAYSYDVVGNLTSHTGPGGTTTYTYDRENDVKTLVPPVGEAIEFDYYEHSYAAVRFPNGVSDAQHYDTDGRIQRIDQYFFDDQAYVYRQLADLHYDYTHPSTGAGTDAVYAITDPDYNYDLAYSYDTAGRITASYGTSEGDIFEETSYTYDANSNRIAWEKGSRGTVRQYTAAYNAANQMTQVTSSTGTTTYDYDGVGNLTGDSDGTAIDYDVRNRAETIDHRYSSDGPQQAEYSGTSQFERTRYGDTTFTNSVLGVTSSTTAEGTTHYLRAPDGRVLGQRGPDGATWYYLTDRLGSITGVTGEDGWQWSGYGYGPYGEYTYGSDAGRHPLIPWRYTGAWLDGTWVTGNGFYKIGLRSYDQRPGRWTQPDPLERVINPTQPAEAQPYNYAGCNPTNQTDPTGATSVRDGIIEAIGLVGACLQGGVIGSTFGGGIGAILGGPFGAAAGGAIGGLYGCVGNLMLRGTTGFSLPGY